MLIPVGNWLGDFEPKYTLFLASQDPPNDVPVGPSAALLKSECGAKASWVKSPGFVFSSKHYFVLKNQDTTLYQFKTDLVSSQPREILYDPPLPSGYITTLFVFQR